MTIIIKFLLFFLVMFEQLDGDTVQEEVEKWKSNPDEYRRKSPVEVT